MNPVLAQLQTIWSSGLQSLPTLLSYTPTTLGFALAAMVLGLTLGFGVAMARLSRVALLRGVAGVYVSFIRGTPLLVQIFVIYYGLPSLGLTFSPVVGGVLALTLNVAAYLSETLRSAIQAVPPGQREAALSLGLDARQTLWLVIMPQAARVALPSLGNSLISLVKDTSLVSVITVVELMRSAQLVVARTFEPFGPYLMAAIVYWVICSVLEVGQSLLERRLSRGFVSE